MIERLCKCLEYGFDNMMVVRSVRNIDVKGCSAVIDESVEEFFYQFNVEIPDFAVT